MQILQNEKMHHDTKGSVYNHITIHNRLWCLLREPEPPLSGHICSLVTIDWRPERDVNTKIEY